MTTIETMPAKKPSLVKKKSPSPTETVSFWRNLSLFLILGIIVVVAALASGIPQHKYKEKTLKKFYAKLVAAERNFDRRTVYDALTHEQRQLQSYEQYVAEKDADRRPLSMDFTIHSYTVDGDRGLIDRTIVACFTLECLGEDRFENRAIKEYLYINGNWYSPRENDLNEAGEVVDQNWPLATPATR